ncbi:tripartite tricarboxylate transporter substrate binding protein [Spiribacter halobius]|uniref:Tripartite tricarboxylate transporter substrate binding protein n=1 Tax=Sediminicurvatus halobius TaxID=2182432 RepID=A0A2U2MX87_9GAMM|nr:tripartite tricarboxylate transporter substrate binding protein [Spiribacter halobius]PWG61478.1 hypothetical protein DEM34_16075 [Spiribacter halobius]UEX77984.1 tripartite tricarboxylate transporter substrate binding protein [Spiribacter halobius]
MKLLQTTKYGLVAGIFALQTLGAAVAADVPDKPGGFPERPITMIVPFGAGGGSDQFARAMAEPMGRIMGVPITVVNKPGGGGRAGIPDFMAAPADGYTILEFSDDVLTLYSSGSIDENPTVDWTPIGIGNITFSQIYIRGDEDRFTDWESFVEYAEENPGSATMANISHEGSLEVISTRALLESVGIELQQVSYDKPTERYAALVGGHTDTLFEQPGDVANLLNSGQFKPILSFLKEAPSSFPDVPTLTDIGVEFEPIFRVRGMVVRGDVPEERKEYLEAVFKAAYESESFQAFLERKNMKMLNNYRGREGSVALIDGMIETFRNAD